jgi:hypothetical protein
MRMAPATHDDLLFGCFQIKNRYLRVVDSTGSGDRE